MKTRWQDWLCLILGSWLFLSPWLLQYITARPYTDQTAASWNSIIFGAAIVTFALIALADMKNKNWEEWVNLILGLWLLVSPWILGFYTRTLATGNMVVIGLIIAILAATALGRRHYHPVAYR
jgi:ABC-type Fe3+-siderophore transport system permease subunit